MNIILAEPRGFCAGVTRAIEVVERALEKFGAPIYVRHEIVHNKFVVDNLRNKGAIFIKEVDEAPKDAVVILSAHGVSSKVEEDANNQGLNVIDATCPLVSKVHREAKKYEDQGYEVILIGHKGHPEVEGTSGRIKKDAIADLILIDLDQVWTIDKEKFYSKSKNSPFNGRKVKGKVLKTIVSGQIVYDCQ